MTKPALVSRERMMALRHLPKSEIAARTGFSIKYLEQRARQLNIRLYCESHESVPTVLQRRCACGRMFACGDVRAQRVCPDCEMEMLGA